MSETPGESPNHTKVAEIPHLIRIATIIVSIVAVSSSIITISQREAVVVGAPVFLQS